MAAPLRFYFDVISPYAYVGWLQAPALAARHGRELQPVPVLFAALLDAHGQRGPAEIPAKKAYVYKDALRKAHRIGATLRLPPTHPFNPLLALRVASVPQPAAQQQRVIDALFAAVWRDGAGVDGPDAVHAALARAALPAAELIAAAGEPDAKARLRAQTDAAIARGVFGVPTVDVDGELFWGSDSVEFIDSFLRGEDPVPAALVAPPSSATRPGSR